MKFSDLKKIRENPFPARKPAALAAEEKTHSPPPGEKAAPAAARLSLKGGGAPFTTRFPLDEDTAETPAPSAGKNETAPIAPAPRHPDSGRLRPPAAPAETLFRELDIQAKKIYARLLAQAVELLNRTNQLYTEQYRAVLEICAEATETLKTNPVLLNYATYSTSGGYLPGHTANTTLLALATGLAAGLESSEMSFLGFCAMAHDVGMTDYAHLYNLDTRLTEDEFSEITRHAETGADKLNCIVDLDYKLKPRAERIILHTHERLDGSGYPDRLSAGDIDQLAQIIGIADVYEAMTHPRAWREALNPPDAVRELIEKEGKGFNSKIVKALVTALSIYPPGSLVVLSTGEFSRVIKVNRGSLTRPLVEILSDAQFHETATRELDLLKHPLTSIARPVSFDEIQKHNPGLAAKLELAHWWTE